MLHSSHDTADPFQIGTSYRTALITGGFVAPSGQQDLSDSKCVCNPSRSTHPVVLYNSQQQQNSFHVLHLALARLLVLLYRQSVFLSGQHNEDMPRGIP